MLTINPINHAPNHVPSAVIYSLMLTCRACGVNPLIWLRHVLTELPQREKAADIGDLLPFNFSKTTKA